MAWRPDHPGRRSHRWDLDRKHGARAGLLRFRCPAGRDPRLEHGRGGGGRPAARPGEQPARSGPPQGPAPRVYAEPQKIFGFPPEFYKTQKPMMINENLAERAREYGARVVV